MIIVVLYARGLSSIYGLLVESVTLTEQVYSPLSAVFTLDMTNCGLVSFPALTLLFLPPGVLQLERTVIEVSTEGGWMEQLRERPEPDTNLVGAVTVTIGPGTEVERSYISSSMRTVAYFELTHLYCYCYSW